MMKLKYSLNEGSAKIKMNVKLICGFKVLTLHISQKEKIINEHRQILKTRVFELCEMWKIKT